MQRWWQAEEEVKIEYDLENLVLRDIFFGCLQYCKKEKYKTPSKDTVLNIFEIREKFEQKFREFSSRRNCKDFHFWALIRLFEKQYIIDILVREITSNQHMRYFSLDTCREREATKNEENQFLLYLSSERAFFFFFLQS